MKVSLTDIYDKDGNLLRIETHDMQGNHHIDFLWDENDPQTSEKRIEFRNWVKRHLKQTDVKVAE